MRTDPKKNAPGTSATGRATIPFPPPRNNTGQSRKQRLFAFKERAVRHLFEHRKSSRRAGGGVPPHHELEPLEVHDLAKLIPEMSAQEYAELRDDIKEKGQLEPIVLYAGKILDGRHRERACRELGLPRDIEAYKGTDPAGFIISKNIKRRQLHLTKQEQVLLIARVLKAARTDLITNIKSVKRDAGGRLKGSTKDEFKAVVVEQSKQAGISRPTVEKAWSEVKREQAWKKSQPAKPRKKKQVDVLKPEYVWHRFGLFLKYWSPEQQRTVRKILGQKLSSRNEN